MPPNEARSIDPAAPENLRHADHISGNLAGKAKARPRCCVQVLPVEYGGQAAMVPIEDAVAARRAAEFAPQQQQPQQQHRRRSLAERPTAVLHAPQCVVEHAK